jgi:cytochrome c-type biogenesis protein CcmE
VAVILLGAVAFLVYQGLNNATLYFRNADRAVAEREDLGDRRFRLQGTVVDGSVEQEGDGVVFAVEHGGQQVEVHHLGDPPELFQPGLPVVLEGSWADGEPWFASDRILVKHTNEYRADNPDRVPADAP